MGEKQNKKKITFKHNRHMSLMRDAEDDTYENKAPELSSGEITTTFFFCVCGEKKEKSTERNSAWGEKKKKSQAAVKGLHALHDANYTYASSLR